MVDYPHGRCPNFGRVDWSASEYSYRPGWTPKDSQLGVEAQLLDESSRSLCSCGGWTGQWLLDTSEFKNWTEGEIRFLWCCGDRKVHILTEWLIVDSRSGKDNSQVCGNFFNYRILCSAIVVNHLEMKFKGVTNVAIACVYFNYKEATTTKDIVADILKQLWEQTPTLSDQAQDLYCTHQQRGTEPNIKEILPLLSSESDRVSKLVNVLDARVRTACCESGGLGSPLALCSLPLHRFRLFKPYSLKFKFPSVPSTKADF
jgi:hypothetical protein